MPFEWRRMRLYHVAIALALPMGAGAATIDLGAGQELVRLQGAAGQDWLGTAVAAGDATGDGVLDLMVSAPGVNSPSSDVGRVYLFAGSDSLESLSIQDAILRVTGWVPYSWIGNGSTSVAAGDVNGDGPADVIIGSPHGSLREGGEVLVYHGGSGLAGPIDRGPGDADFTVLGREEPMSLGWSVATGDVNADGIGDLVIGAPSANPNGMEYAGEVHVVLGGASLPDTLDLAGGSGALVVTGSESQDHLGRYVACEDLNGDGFSDIIMGSDSDGPPGRAGGALYVVFGDTVLPEWIDLSQSAPDLTVWGDDAGDGLGVSAAGDVDGDGIDDLVIGAYGADQPGRTRCGEAYVLLGRYSWPDTIDLDVVAPDMRLIGSGAEDYLGRAVAAGDFNGDGVADILVGADGVDHGGQADVGDAYVIYGGAPLPALIDLSVEAPDVLIRGDGQEAGDRWGRSLAMGDLDGDGRAEIALGAWEADPQGMARAGEVAVVSSSVLPTGVASLELRPRPPLTVSLQPNPFNPSVEVRLAVAPGARYSARVYDVEGRLVASLGQGVASTREVVLRWDGTDQRGGAASSGVYFLRVEAGQGTAVRKAVLLR